MTFPSDISSCVATATPGVWHGGGITNDAVGTTIVASSGTTITVFFNENGGNASNTDFMLTVAC